MRFWKHGKRDGIEEDGMASEWRSKSRSGDASAKECSAEHRQRNDKTNYGEALISLAETCGEMDMSGTELFGIGEEMTSIDTAREKMSKVQTSYGREQ